MIKYHTINVSQKPHQILFLDGLERNADDVTDELPDGIVEATDLLEEQRILRDAGPEQGKVALLQNVSQVDDFLDCVVVHLGRK